MLTPLTAVLIVAAACAGQGAAAPTPTAPSTTTASPTTAGESKPGGIQGTVAGPEGRPVAGMRVAIVGGTAAFPEIASETDEDGRYQIGGVAPGTFQVAGHDIQGERIGLGSIVVTSGETATLNLSVSAGKTVENQAPLPPLPVIRLRHAGQIHDGVQGSYCWPVARTDEGYTEKLCADKVSWEALGAPIPMGAGDRVTVEIEAGEPSQELSAGFFEPGSDSGIRLATLDPGPAAALPVDLPPGVYNLRVFGRWPKGDISYEFSVEILPEPSAEQKEPANRLCLPDKALGVSIDDFRQGEQSAGISR